MNSIYKNSLMKDYCRYKIMDVVEETIEPRNTMMFTLPSDSMVLESHLSEIHSNLELHGVERNLREDVDML